MLVSGFNHAHKPQDFVKFFGKNDKPLIYHFEDGRTLVMNKQDTGYAAVADGKMYVLDNAGMSESEIGGSSITTVDIGTTTYNVDESEPLFNILREFNPRKQYNFIRGESNSSVYSGTNDMITILFVDYSSYKFHVTAIRYKYVDFGADGQFYEPVTETIY